MDSREQADRQAFQRHIVISMMRLFGVGIFIVGLLVFLGRVELAGEGADKIVGGVLMLVGLGDFAIVPLLMARKWKSPDQP